MVSRACGSPEIHILIIALIGLLDVISLKLVLLCLLCQLRLYFMGLITIIDMILRGLGSLSSSNSIALNRHTQVECRSLSGLFVNRINCFFTGLLLGCLRLLTQFRFCKPLRIISVTSRCGCLGCHLIGLIFLIL
jgi:hypothetical protein